MSEQSIERNQILFGRELPVKQAKPGRNVNYAREHTRLLCATTRSCVQYESRYQRHHHVIFEELYANNPSAVLLYIACRAQLKTIATTQIVDKL